MQEWPVTPRARRASSAYAKARARYLDVERRAFAGEVSSVALDQALSEVEAALATLDQVLLEEARKRVGL